MVMNPGITTVETYQDRKIIAFLGYAGPIISVLLAAEQGDLLAGTLLGKDAVAGSYKQYLPAVAASLITGDVESKNAIVFRALAPGVAGEVIKVELKDPAGVSQALAVTAANNTVVISLATGETGDITSTAAEVIAAVNGSQDLISAAKSGASDGTGVVEAVAATALDNGADANVVPNVILGENVLNQAGAVSVEAYLGGVFYSNMLVGLDAAAKANLGARVVDDVTIIPV